MRRRFVIGVEEFDKDQERRFREYIAKVGAWWHWIDNLWLLTTKRADVTATDIRDYALELNPAARVVVLEFPEDVTWAASAARNRAGKSMSEWFLSPWGDD